MRVASAEQADLNWRADLQVARTPVVAHDRHLCIRHSDDHSFLGASLSPPISTCC
jgi:hypothetical protein